LVGEDCEEALTELAAAAASLSWNLIIGSSPRDDR
jgi:hypothetical protein